MGVTPTSDTRSPVERHVDRAAALLAAWQDRDRLDPDEPTLGQRIAAALAQVERAAYEAGREVGRTEGLREALDTVADLLPDDDPPGRPL